MFPFSHSNISKNQIDISSRVVHKVTAFAIFCNALPISDYQLNSLKWKNAEGISCSRG